MNSNRVKEIKKEDKKAFKSFIIIMIILRRAVYVKFNFFSRKNSKKCISC